MALTPNEILYKEFDTKFRGYHPDQVNDYLDVIVVEFEELLADKADLQDALKEARERLDYFEQLQDSLNNSILVAQEAADRLKQNARKEAELIIYEAEREGDQLVNTASQKANRIMMETEALRRHSQGFRQQLRVMTQEQLNLINDERYDELFDDFDQFKDQTTVKRESNSSSERVDHLVNAMEEDFGVAERLAQDHEKYVQPESESKPVTNDDEETAEDLEETKVLSTEDLYIEETVDHSESEEAEQSTSENIMGQTIRIELPEDK